MALNQQELDIARQVKEQGGSREDFIEILEQMRGKQEAKLPELEPTPEPPEPEALSLGEKITTQVEGIEEAGRARQQKGIERGETTTEVAGIIQEKSAPLTGLTRIIGEETFGKAASGFLGGVSKLTNKIFQMITGKSDEEVAEINKRVDAFKAGKAEEIGAGIEQARKESETFDNIAQQIENIAVVVEPVLELTALKKPTQLLAKAGAKKLSASGLGLKPNQIDRIKKQGIDPEDFLLEKGISGTKVQIQKKAGELADNSFKELNKRVAGVKGLFINESSNKILQAVTSKLDGVIGLEDEFADAVKLSEKAKNGLTLTEHLEIKRLSDKYLDLYKVTGDPKIALEKQGLVKLRRDVRDFIDDVGTEKGVPGVKELSRDIAVGKDIEKSLESVLSTAGKQNFISLSDLLLFTAGGVASGPLAGFATVLAKGLFGSSFTKTNLARLLNTLSPAQKAKINSVFKTEAIKQRVNSAQVEAVREVLEETKKPGVLETIKSVGKAPGPIKAKAKEAAGKILRLMGNDIDDIVVIGSTARGKLKPNDLDILITPKKPFKELTSEGLRDRLSLQKLTERELQGIFPGKKLHVTFSEYKQERGPKIELDQVKKPGVLETIKSVGKTLWGLKLFQDLGKKTPKLKQETKTFEKPKPGPLDSIKKKPKAKSVEAPKVFKNIGEKIPKELEFISKKIEKFDTAEEAFNFMKNEKGISPEVAEIFRKTFDPNNNKTQQEAFKEFYDLAKLKQKTRTFESKVEGELPGGSTLINEAKKFKNVDDNEDLTKISKTELDQLDNKFRRDRFNAEKGSKEKQLANEQLEAVGNERKRRGELELDEFLAKNKPDAKEKIEIEKRNKKFQSQLVSRDFNNKFAKLRKSLNDTAKNPIIFELNGNKYKISEFIDTVRFGGDKSFELSPFGNETPKGIIRLANDEVFKLKPLGTIKQVQGKSGLEDVFELDLRLKKLFSSIPDELKRGPKIELDQVKKPGVLETIKSVGKTLGGLKLFQDLGKKTPKLKKETRIFETKVEGEFKQITKAGEQVVFDKHITSDTQKTRGGGRAMKPPYSSWFEQENHLAKMRIVDDINSKPDLKNAFLNSFHKNYQDLTGNNISFDEFLDADITVYRGVGKGELPIEGFESFTINKDLAQKFADGRDGGKVISKTVKPRDTLGLFPGFEPEVMIPTLFRSKKSILNEINTGPYSMKQIQEAFKGLDFETIEDLKKGLEKLKNISP